MNGSPPKLFAHGPSPSGQDLANLHLTFRDLALKHWRCIRRKFKGYYEWGDFACDAAATVVLLGTALTNLMGQNDKEGGKPSPRTLAAKHLKVEEARLKDSHPALCAFIDLYNACHHFGQPKHAEVEKFFGTPASDDRLSHGKHLCEALNAAEELWASVMSEVSPHRHEACRFALC